MDESDGTGAIDTIAILGGGTMGGGIAIAFAAAGSDVIIADVDAERTAAAKRALVERVRAQVAAGLRPAEVAERVEAVRTASDPVAAVDGVQLVCEAVPEVLDLKLRVLAAIEPALAPEAIVATNTSSFPIDDLAGALTKPERLVGMHWFNPAEWVPGVEVILGSATAPEVAQRCERVLRAAGKRPARVASSPGFIANRLQMALFAEAVSCVEEGLATPEAVDDVARSTFGFRLPHYGPFAIADMAGLDVYAAVFDTLRNGLGERFAAPRMLLDLVEQGRFGTKTSAGFATYDADEGSRMHRERDRRYAATSRFLDELDD